MCASSKYKLRQIHAFSIRHGVPLNNPDMGKHLIYTIVSLSAPMSYAHHVFAVLHNPNVFTWNTMIKGYAETENPIPAFHLYRYMVMSGVEPDTHTYPFLLKAVAKSLNVREGETIHSVTIRNGFESLLFVQNSLLHTYATFGHTESAHQMFESMKERDLVAWNSVINGFALNGRPNEALTLFRKMSVEGVEPDGFTMVSLLSACAELGALELGCRVHVYSFKVDVQLVRRSMLNDGVKKTPGYSFVELGNRVYEFTIGDRSHPQSQDVYALLEKITELLKLEGYVPHTANVLADIEEEEKEQALSYHSEKVAIAFMLLNTAPGTPIRVMKNLRVCADCHMAIKLISKVYDREIVIRDRSRFHHFRGGSCSCKDYW
ncbi:hypothetical protein TanjilG_09520 [Lupinus angustifolius]|uniref:DYW domain-containing protein n=1 Tax=Lupinus angustifolius TaxID=3871 RepID=A0A394DA42_LUPAN|nr:hypothetical protein TanjilG_09520 [Lupinus angustifolius]